MHTCDSSMNVQLASFKLPLKAIDSYTSWSEIVWGWPAQPNTKKINLLELFDLNLDRLKFHCKSTNLSFLEQSLQTINMIFIACKKPQTNRSEHDVDSMISSLEGSRQ